MRSTDFPFAVMPQRFDKGGPSFADRARTVAKGATFAFNDEIEAGLRALAKLDPAAYQREVARIRAQQAAYEAANPYESAGLEIGGAMLPALLPGGQGLAAARVAALAGKAPRLAARIAPVVGEAALYGVGAADSMADIPSSVVSEGAQALAMYGVGAAAAPRLKALGSKLAARLRPNKGTAPPAMAVKPQTLPAPEAPLAVKPQGITAYHGSPHSFDRFDMSKIGTGEGAQAYGRGLYFAENEAVAKGYRDDLTNPDNMRLHINDKPVDEVWSDGLRQKFPEMYGGLGPSSAEDMDALLGTLAQETDMGNIGSVLQSLGHKRYEQLYKSRVAPFIGKPELGPGSMYQVRIDADPADFLDWDAPLSGQSEKVRAGVDAVARFTQRERETLPVRNALEIMGSAGEASAKLREAGIPGIKYLDQGSRTAGDGSRNYVVFDDKLITILKKYGWAPGMAIPAAAMAEYEAEQELARGGFAVKKGR